MQDILRNVDTHWPGEVAADGESDSASYGLDTRHQDATGHLIGSVCRQLEEGSLDKRS